MKNHFVLFFLIACSVCQMGMARKGQYDEEAREAERQGKAQTKKYQAPSPAEAAKRFVGGVKQATVDSAAGLVSDTVATTKSGAAAHSNGMHEGESAVLDNTIKGVAKVATLGYGEVKHYEVEEPRAGTDDTSKIKIKW